jgi:hypothetical protein
MKLPLTGTFRDHNRTQIAYKLQRQEQQDEMQGWWHCLIDPHGVDQWNAAGSGRTHAEAMKTARAWWKQYDEQPA